MEYEQGGSDARRSGPAGSGRLRRLRAIQRKWDLPTEPKASIGLVRTDDTAAGSMHGSSAAPAAPAESDALGADGVDGRVGYAAAHTGNDSSGVSPFERATGAWPSHAHPERRFARPIRRMTALLLLVAVLALTAAAGLSAYQQYSHVRAEAVDGVSHLQRVQALLAPLLQHPGIPDAATLQSVRGELLTAQHDFALTRRDLGLGAFSLAASVPAGKATLDPIVALSAAADEGCQAGLALVAGGDLLLPALHGTLFAGSTAATPSGAPASGAASGATTPALTVGMLAQVTTDFEDAARHLAAAVAYARDADLSALPTSLITAQQRAAVQTALAQWPHIAQELTTADAWLHVAPELLGLNGPMSLLVELMDRGEMRPAGGYIGDYGIMTIQNAQLQPFSLQNVYSLDFRYKGHSAPAAYWWWPFADFGLRDSNVSPDFPTSAQIGMQLVAKEGGPSVQGAVGINVMAIARVLAILGPLTVPGYAQVVTAENLEDVIRLYTENPTAVLTVWHDQFTEALGHAFMEKLHGLSGNQFLPIAQAMLASLHAKDIQVYLSDKSAETLVAQQGFDGAITQGPGDGLTIADANVAVNKANVVTTATYDDAVTLDTSGTATHHLTLTYDFNTSRKPAIREFLFDTDSYLTYLRVYAPPNAQLVGLDGFNRGKTQINHSDLAGRQMWGGYVLVHDGVPYVLHFVWSVPNAATRGPMGKWSYRLTVQHQPGANQQLNLSITTPGTDGPSTTFSGALDQDRVFTLTQLS